MVCCNNFRKMICAIIMIVFMVMFSSCLLLLPSYATETDTSSQQVIEEPETEAPAVEEPEVPVKIYSIGDPGPAGGLVFYDKGEYGDGWRFLEAASAGWSGSPYDPKAQWGAFPFTMNGAVLKTGLGDGLENSEHIVNYNKHIQANRETYDQLPEGQKVLAYDHNGTVAAALCLDAVINGFDDWYLPSQDELELVRNNLYKNNLGSLQADLFWSSSMSNDRSGTMMNFWNGAIGGSYSNTSYYVRPVRKF